MGKLWRNKDGSLRRPLLALVVRVGGPLVWTAGTVALTALGSLGVLHWQHSATVFDKAPPCPAATAATVPVAADSATCVLPTRVAVNSASLDLSGYDNVVQNTSITLVGPALTRGSDTVMINGDRRRYIQTGTVVPVSVWRGTVVRFTVLGSEYRAGLNPDNRLSTLRILLALTCGSCCSSPAYCRGSSTRTWKARPSASRTVWTPAPPH